MKAKILDEFDESNSKCYLSSVNLKDYIVALPQDYKDYEVQREIVTNSYLDALINTIINKNHIPPIVLVVEDSDFSIEKQSITINTFKILDGLQRTFRLKVIFETIELIDKELQFGREFLEFSKLRLAKQFRSELERIHSSNSLLSKLIEHYKLNENVKLDTLFDRRQWFEIWTNLDADAEVTKMLILNAGHKAVKTKHQLELLFRNILPLLEKAGSPSFQAIRDKESSAFNLGKVRKPGQFLFSHLITSLLSFSEAKPLTTNTDLIQKSQNEQYNDEIFDELLKFNFLTKFIQTLITLDVNLSTTYGVVGVQWLGRETCLVGIFAAIGKYAKSESVAPLTAMEIFDEKIATYVSILNLNEFEVVRNSLDLAKINFGTINKKAVSSSVYDILKGEIQSDEIVNWDYYFNN